MAGPEPCALVVGSGSGSKILLTGLAAACINGFMTSFNKPWDIDAALTEERLRLLAGTIQEVRDAALQLHDPSSGESTWSLGCRCYERLQRRFQRLADGEWSPWFRYAPLGPRLAYLIHFEGVAIRHYWAPFADEADPPPKAVRRAFENIERAKQMSLPGFEENPKKDRTLTWLLQVGTDRIDLGVDRVIIFRADEEGEVQNEYLIPLEPGVRVAAAARETPPPPVEIEPPTIGRKRLDDGKTGSGDGDPE